MTRFIYLVQSLAILLLYDGLLTTSAFAGVVDTPLPVLNGDSVVHVSAVPGECI